MNKLKTKTLSEEFQKLRHCQKNSKNQDIVRRILKTKKFFKN